MFQLIFIIYSLAYVFKWNIYRPWEMHIYSQISLSYVFKWNILMSCRNAGVQWCYIYYRFFYFVWSSKLYGRRYHNCTSMLGASYSAEILYIIDHLSMLLLSCCPYLQPCSNPCCEIELVNYAIWCCYFQSCSPWAALCWKALASWSYSSPSSGGSTLL